MRQYLNAKANGKRLAKRLGRGWKPEEWENLGWHFKVTSPCGRIKVHAGLGHYAAFLGEPGSSGGPYCEDGRTPEAAIKNVVATAKARLSKIGAVIKGL